MIYLYTGSNGSGKTLNAIKFIVEELNPDGSRPVFFYAPPSQPIGITEAGVLDWTPLELEQVREWYNCPEGSIFLVDEFRHVWPWRDHKKAPPESVDRLAEHRSKGFDFVLTAQKPSAQFDPAIQGFIEEHRHLEGIRGSKRSKHFVYQSFCSSPVNPPKLQTPDVQTVPFDKKYFSYYRSASLHTHKDRLPYKKLIPLGLAILCVPLLFWFAFKTVGNIAGDEEMNDSLDTVERPSTMAFTPAAVREPVKTEDYWERHQPRVAGLPHTAPIYDELTRPQSAPMPRACIVNHAEDSCTCYTQQATKLSVPDSFCRSAVAHGWFDHTRSDESRQSADSWEGGEPMRGPRSHAPAPSGPQYSSSM